MKRARKKHPGFLLADLLLGLSLSLLGMALTLPWLGQ